MARIKTVAGNWKMNTLPEEAYSLASEIENMAKDELDSSVRLIICPPFVYLNPIRKMLGKDSRVYMGAQNCFYKDSGAFTGEISPSMLRELEAQFVILGHSERRAMGETDDLIKQKVDAVLEKGLTPIFCCGESLEIRDTGNYLDFVGDQLKASLFHLGGEILKNVVIAYEPIWAIGTGRTASPEQAQEMHAHLRGLIASEKGNDAAQNMTILYGGSAKPGNAKELFSQEDVDGGLIGGASLESRSFIQIAQSF